MYELVKITESSYYIQSPAKIGLIRINDTDVCLIDSGSDKDSGKKALQHIIANGWNLTAVYNTHSNADHIGGNKLLQERTGCKVFAPEIEAAFTNTPVLEPSFLYGGYPFSELRHKFLMAQKSCAEVLQDSNLPKNIQKIDLYGHFFNMVGFRTDDGVVYLADCLSSVQTLDKYRIGFIYDVAAYLDTLEKVKVMSAEMFVPSHAEPIKDISPLAKYNIDKVLEVAEDILGVCTEPVCFEIVLQKLFAKYDLKMTYEQYVLVGSTVRSYLAWLKDSGRVNAFFDNNMLLWQKNVGE